MTVKINFNGPVVIEVNDANEVVSVQVEPYGQRYHDEPHYNTGLGEVSVERWDDICDRNDWGTLYNRDPEGPKSGVNQ